MNFLLLLLLSLSLASCAQQPGSKNPEIPAQDENSEQLDTAALNAKLTPAQYHVICNAGTEPAFTGKYWNFHGDGIYHCARCGHVLFDSKYKYDSGSGWPSFTQPVEDENVGEKEDRTHGMIRTEIVCTKCGAHLGHVFPDGPEPTGLRYCVNSLSLEFEERK